MMRPFGPMKKTEPIGQIGPRELTGQIGRNEPAGAYGQMPPAFLALPEALQHRAALLLDETSFASAAAVEQFGGGMLRASQELSRRFSQTVLGYNSEAAHLAVAEARRLVMLLDPAIAQRSLPARLIYGFQTFGLARQVARLAPDLDAIAAIITGQEEALGPFQQAFEQLISELNIGSAVLQAAADEQHRALRTRPPEEALSDDVVWRQSQYDRIVLRETLFRALRASIEAKMRTVVALRTALRQLLGLVDGFAQQILPLWRRDLTAISGLSAVVAPKIHMCSDMAERVRVIDQALSNLDHFADQIGHIAASNHPS